MNLPAVRFEDRRVERIIFRRSAAGDLEADLHRAAFDLLADDALHLRFQRRIAFTGAHGKLEIPVIDGAHFHHHGQAVGLLVGFAKTGHAQQQRKLRREKEK